MNNEAFHDKVDKMFESRLKRHSIRIKDIERDRILGDNEINYNRVLFDSNLNIYKIVDGVPVLVENDNFKALWI